MEPGAIPVVNPVIFGQILFWLVNAHATPMIKYFEYPLPPAVKKNFLAMKVLAITWVSRGGYTLPVWGPPL